MPTYQYACTNPECGENFELVQSFTDPTASECPVCGGPVRKVFSAVGVVFKGSGFYRNDSRSGAKSGGSSKESSTDSKSEKKSESSAKSESTKSESSSTPSTSDSSSSKSSGSSSKAAAPA